MTRTIAILQTLSVLILMSLGTVLIKLALSDMSAFTLAWITVAVAMAARTIAEHCNYPAVEEAYVGGLLYDIGKVVLDSNVPEEYQGVIELVYNEGRWWIAGVAWDEEIGAGPLPEKYLPSE